MAFLKAPLRKLNYPRSRPGETGQGGTKVIAEETWRRYRENWGALALAGLFAMLVSLVLMALSRIFVVPVLVSAGLTLNGFGSGGFDALARIAAGLGAALLLMVIAFLLVAPIGQGGLIYGVVRVMQGRPASFGELWQAGLRNWGRLVRLNLVLILVGILLMILLLILRLIPVLGPLVWAIGTAMIMLALSGYGPYIAVSRDVGACQAAARALGGLRAKCVDVLLTLLVLMAATFVLGLAASILSFIPLLGKLVPFLTQILVSPLGLLYLAVRYERNIAGDAGPPGGSGAFYQGPPPGV